MADEPQPKPRREIRIPIPDLDGLKASALEKKENAFAVIGLWCKQHPFIATVITLVLFYIVKTIVVETYR